MDEWISSNTPLPLQAHSALETKPSFRFILHGTRLAVPLPTLEKLRIKKLLLPQSDFNDDVRGNA